MELSPKEVSAALDNFTERHYVGTHLSSLMKYSAAMNSSIFGTLLELALEYPGSNALDLAG